MELGPCVYETVVRDEGAIGREHGIEIARNDTAACAAQECSYDRELSGPEGGLYWEGV